MENDRPLIEINKDKCSLSYACVRVCPVKAIQVKDNDEYPSVEHKRCIGCGACVGVCSSNAITYTDDKVGTKAILKAKEKKIAIVAPSIASEFSDISDYRKFIEMLRVLGFNYIQEASFAVDLIAQHYSELFKNDKGKYYITTTCPVVVDYVEKYAPDLTENLAPLISPMITATKIVREIYGKKSKVVYIGPCIANKNEAKKYSGLAKPDSVITYKELRELFTEFDITEKSLKFSDFDGPTGHKGALYPISKGIIEAAGIEDEYLTTNVMTRDGGSRVLKAIKEFEEYITTFKHHLNLFYCEGCMMGPGTTNENGFLMRKNLITEYARKRADNFDKESWQYDINTFKGLDYSTSFKSNDVRVPIPERKKVEEVMKVIGKSNTTSKLGCGSCGYDSCNDFAESVAKGLAKTDMCITHSLNNQQEYIKILKKTNEKLAITQDKLQDSENIARKEHAAAIEALETTKAMMEELPAGVIIVDADLKILSSNKGFIKILGEEAKEINEIIPGLVGADLKSLIPYNFYNIFSFVLNNANKIENKDIQLNDNLLNVSVFSIKANKIVGAVVRDMYEPEIRKEEVINRVTDVIDQNLAMVQQIGFLLGEGASQTEKMLNSIIKTYKLDNKE